MPRRSHYLGLTLLETAMAITLIAVLLSILLPALSSARSASFKDRCKQNQRIFGEAWQSYLADHNQQFPTVPVQPGWQYAGVRFTIDGNMRPDSDRPLTPYLPISRTGDAHELVCFCPSDRGISGPEGSPGKSRRTALRSFGTSYRANGALLYSMPQVATDALDQIDEGRGLFRHEITTAPSRLVLMGDPVWYEVAESTGREADWHGEANAGNLLFLDGSVRFMAVRPRRQGMGPAVFDPIMPGAVRVTEEDAAVNPPATETPAPASTPAPDLDSDPAAPLDPPGERPHH